MLLAQVFLIFCAAKATSAIPIPPLFRDDMEMVSYDSDSSRTLSASPPAENRRVQKKEERHKSRTIHYAQLGSDSDVLVQQMRRSKKWVIDVLDVMENCVSTPLVETVLGSNPTFRTSPGRHLVLEAVGKHGLIRCL